MTAQCKVESFHVLQIMCSAKKIYRAKQTLERSNNNKLEKNSALGRSIAKINDTGNSIFILKTE